MGTAAARVRPLPTTAPTSAPRRERTGERVIAMLHGMGYRKSESRWLVWSALRGGELPSERPATDAELLRAALRAGGPRRPGPVRSTSRSS